MRESRERRRWRGAIAIAAVVVVAVIVGACSNPTNSEDGGGGNGSGTDEPETYTVSFDRQGGSGGSTSVIATFGSAMPSATAPSTTGVVFDGYYTGLDGTGTQYYTATMDSARDWDLPANTELIANWRPYEVRETGPGGGIVFYDKGAYSDGWRYLEAAPASTEWESKPWGGRGTLVGSGAQGTAIGTGAANTQAIVAEYGDTEPDAGRADYAAKLAADLDHGGYDDWFLPSKDELNQMYLQRVVIGGFASAGYWSSSELNANGAWLQYFGGGSQNDDRKNFDPRVRAVRAF